jgi:hypothetical protein
MVDLMRLMVVLFLTLPALAGCAASAPECPTGQEYSSGSRKGQCVSATDLKRFQAEERRVDAATKRALEAEEILRHRRAEELANAVEAMN